MRRSERRALPSLRAAARAGCGAGAAERSHTTTVAYDSGADRDQRGGGAARTAIGRADEPGQSEVKDEFRSGPGGAPGATLTQPPVGGGDGGPPVLALIALAFVLGFAAVWTVERRRVA